MIKNLLFLIITVIGLYIFIAFKMPNLALNIEKTIGINLLGNSIVNFNKTTESVKNNTPSKDEIINTYNKTYSGAIKVKDSIILGVETTKTKINDVRETVVGLEESYNEIKDGINDIKDSYNNAKEFIDSNSGTINEIGEFVGSISSTTHNLVSSGAISNTGSTNTGTTNSGATSSGITN